MSMILDALARAERERKQDHADVTREEHYDRPPVKSQQPVKHWVLLALVVNLLVLGTIFFYLYTQNTTKETSSVASPEVSTRESNDSVNRVATQTTASTDLLAEAEVRTDSTNASEQSASKSAQPKLDAQVESSKSLHQEALVVGVTPVPKPKSTPKPKVSYSQVPLTPKAKAESVPLPVEAKKASTYPLVKDLSSDMRSRLSKYEVNVHVHDSKPRNRFVLINMTKYREGDQIASGGPRVVEITTEGVVVDYGGGKALLQRN